MASLGSPSPCSVLGECDSGSSDGDVEYQPHPSAVPSYLLVSVQKSDKNMPAFSTWIDRRCTTGDFMKALQDGDPRARLCHVHGLQLSKH